MTITTQHTNSGKYLITATHTDNSAFMATHIDRCKAFSMAVRGCYKYIQDMGVKINDPS